MNILDLSIKAFSIAYEQLDPIPHLNNPFSLSIDKPPWCVKPRHVAKLADIENGIIIDVEDFHIIGRGDQSTIVIESLLVSRCHAALLHHCSGEFYLIDLASTHGTFIGRMRLNPYVPTLVRKGSLIRFGAAKNQYLFCGFPTVDEIMNTAKDIRSEEEKCLFVNTEFNRRLPFQDNIPILDKGQQENSDFKLLLNEVNKPFISISIPKSSNSIQSTRKSILFSDRNGLSRRDTFDFTESESESSLQDYNPSGLIKRNSVESLNLIDVSASHENDSYSNEGIGIYTRYFHNFEKRLHHSKKSLNKKRNRCTYDDGYQDDMDSNDSLLSTEHELFHTFCQRKRVRFQQISLSPHHHHHDDEAADDNDNVSCGSSEGTSSDDQLSIHGSSDDNDIYGPSN